MKKLSFIIAMVLVSGFAMAQNTASITSIGDYQDATVKQGIPKNTGIIYQTASGVSAAINDRTSASIEQISGDYATINQDGKRQVAWIYQNTNSVGTIVQTGSWNSSGDYIAGDHNYIQVVQNGFLNNGNIETLSNENGTSTNPLNIYQNGDQNWAQIHSGVLTSSNFDLASISQLGNLNISNVNQEGGDWNSATVLQYTNKNVANLNQSGSNLTSTITQTGGDANIVNLNQTSGVASIYQNGTGNLVEGLNPDVWASFAGSTLNVTQLGQSNTLDLKSTTSGAKVDVYQNGMLNMSTVNN